jgi:hypothetical protein
MDPECLILPIQGPHKVDIIEQFPGILYLILFQFASAHADAQIYQAVSRRGELAQLDAAFGKDSGRLVVDEVALVVDHLADANLCYFDAACQARTRVAVQDGVLADAVATSFEECVFFGVQTEAGGEADTSLGSVVAAGACRW